jgi:hypothetical protein
MYRKWLPGSMGSNVQFTGKTLPHVTCYSKGRKVNLSLCLTNQALSHEDLWGNGCIDPRFLDLRIARNVFTELCADKLVLFNFFNDYVPSELAQALVKQK